MGRHEESWISTDLAQLGVPETVFDDAVDEAEGDGVVLHLGVVELLELECRAYHNGNGVKPTVEGAGSLQRDPLVQFGRRVQVAAHEHELVKDGFELASVRVYDFVFLEGFQVT